MFSKVEMPSDAFSGKSVGEKRQSPTRINTKTALLGLLLSFLVGVVIVQTVYLKQVAHRLEIVEEIAWLNTQTMGTETMTLHEAESTNNTNRNRRSASVSGYQIRHSSMVPNEQNAPSLPSAHLVANVETSVAAGTISIKQPTNQPTNKSTSQTLRFTS
ncbi:uncharacterized protein LOC117103341 [Anneissia japonica]|uniref:uncharacterized protein LOC117103341 n=1 Tax=Anneissia japonica TaxID=1529436 RepID=UPI00142591E0|nr:uncharacterized protein LOC117103341 [Anneissia japonica]